jgi:hypothetical protein
MGVTLLEVKKDDLNHEGHQGHQEQRTTRIVVKPKNYFAFLGALRVFVVKQPLRSSFEKRKK